jgi:hypothetical protein
MNNFERLPGPVALPRVGFRRVPEGNSYIDAIGFFPKRQNERRGKNGFPPGPSGRLISFEDYSPSQRLVQTPPQTGESLQLQRRPASLAGRDGKEEGQGMRIYLAGVYKGGRACAFSKSASIHLRVSRDYNYPWVLESFFYVDAQMVRAIRRCEQNIFLDSGAYSMFTQGVKIDPRKYARFISYNLDLIHIASNLDAIGEGHEQESYDRQKLLESYLGEHKHLVKPVHHVRDQDHWLQRYLDDGYDYIFLGGMVPESTPKLTKWLDHIWHCYLTNPDGSPKIKVHGFGLTTETLMFRYPWYSVDSTSWLMSSRYGSMFMDFPQPDGSIRIQKIDFSALSKKQYDIDSWHFDSLPPDEQEVVRARLEQLEAERERDPELEARFRQIVGCKMGYNPEALAKSYGMRDLGNMEYFRRASVGHPIPACLQQRGEIN